MTIERYIYIPPDLVNECANIYLDISGSLEYTIYVKALSLIDGLFSLRICNVKAKHVFAACNLVLNTLHMYYLPYTVCQDTIDNDKEKTFKTFKTMMNKPHVFDTCTLSGWYNGFITVNTDGTLTFEWERPPFHVADVCNNSYLHKSAKASADTHFQQMMHYYRQSTLEPAPTSFQHPRI